MSNATAAAAPTERDPRTLVLLGLSLVIWLGAAVRSYLPPLLQPFPAANHQSGAGEGSPSGRAEEQTGPGGNSAAQALVAFQPIPINHADREALIALDGIGPVLADRLIEWRKEHGRFRNGDDLLAVRGIGPKKLAKILPQITFQ